MAQAQRPSAVSESKLAKALELRAAGWLTAIEAAEQHGIRTEAFLHRAVGRSNAIGFPAVLLRINEFGRLVRCSLYSPDQIRAVTTDYVPIVRRPAANIKNRDGLLKRFGYNPVPASALDDYVPFDDVCVMAGVSHEKMLRKRVFRVFGLLVPEDVLCCESTPDKNPWIGPRLFAILLGKSVGEKSQPVYAKHVDRSYRYDILNGELVIKGD